MKYEVFEGKGADRKSREIELRELGENHYELILDGERTEVDVVKSGPTVYSMIENGHQVEAMVDDKTDSDIDITTGGHLFHFSVVDERSRALLATASVQTSGPQRVEAEMPGKVVQVLVSLDDEVVAGTGIAIIEAMKMENEIKSPIDGRVTEIAVEPGQTVEPTQLLFVVEPVEAGE